MPAYDNEGATISMEDVRPPELRISTTEDDLLEKRLQLKPQKSTISSRKKQAVCVRRAFKRYGSKSNPNIILDGLNMTVPKGSIYGLLGASGCGKTTLLSCIVGRRRLNAGEIWVLGGRPGSPGSGVPGPRIGYMPQEVALFGEFSIRETMMYFGWIAGLSTRQVDERVDFLVSLLQLPNHSKQVKNLSGGQQRRVSLAAALLHDPELLILDEPTVGVDPVLRQSIWDHLVEITRGGRTTVIITTHYIDETKQANIIGLMRGGKFLAEESPQELINRYQAESLESVFLKLSVLQNRGKRRRSSILKSVVDKVELPSITDPTGVETEESEYGEISGEFGDNVSMSSRGAVFKPDIKIPAVDLPPEEKPPQGCLERIKPMKWQNMRALIWKNFFSLFRNFGILAFIIGLPLSQMIFFCLAIGHYPVGLPIAVVNDELIAHNLTQCPVQNLNECPRDNETLEWNVKLFSCRYLHYLSIKQNNLIPYPNKTYALKEAVEGKTRAVLVIPWNFTECLVEKFTDGRRIDNYTIENSSMEAHLDNTDKQVEWMLKANMQLTLMDTLEQLAISCDLPPRIMSSPVHFLKPVYGLEEPNFTDFAYPGVLLTIIFFLAVALTSGSMLAERNSGILERSLVSGITGTEILFSHVIVQMLVMMAQSVVVLIIGFVAFRLTIVGPIGWVIFLTLITGLCGMTFGFVVSCLCDTERTATYLALGSFLPMVMLCGIIWPTEGMHIVLQWISFILPLTKSTESMRSMLQRGWSITQPVVYYGFISTSLWITVYLITSILLIKFKKG